MAFAAIAFTIPQYENFPNYWMKPFEQGTTTPKVMALDAVAAVTVAKLELNSSGFPVTTGSALVIPYIDGAYDLWLFPTEALADANDTTNAIQLADNITGISSSSSVNQNELTTATMAANTNKTYEVGDIVNTKEFATGEGVAGGGTYDAVLTSSVTPNTYNIIIGTADALISFVLRVYEEVKVAAFGLAGSGADNQGVIDAAITFISAGGTLKFPPGTFATAGGHAWPAHSNIDGAGLGATVIVGTSSAIGLFNTLGDGTNITFGGNVMSNLTLDGVDRTGTSFGVNISTRVRITFNNVQFTNCEYGIKGIRGTATESVNSLTVENCRFIFNYFDIYAPNQWNGFRISFDTQFASSLGWSVRVYDATGVDLGGTFQGTPTDANTGHVFLGGCSGISYSAYHEGDPTDDHFVRISSALDESGSATNGGVAMQVSNSGLFAGCRFSSAGGTAYGFKIVGARSLLFTGNQAGSGISTSLVYSGTGSNGNTFLANWAGAGTIVTYQTASEVDFNHEQVAGTAGAISSTAQTNIVTTKLDVSGAPSDKTGGLVSFGLGSDASIYWDNARDDDTATLNINNFGYLGSTTRFRRTIIGDGKNASIFSVLPDAGTVETELPLKLKVYTDGNRPAASGLPAGSSIWNSDDNFINTSDGTNWRDPTGATT